MTATYVRLFSLRVGAEAEEWDARMREGGGGGVAEAVTNWAREWVRAETGPKRFRSAAEGRLVGVEGVGGGEGGSEEGRRVVGRGRNRRRGGAQQGGWKQRSRQANKRQTAGARGARAAETRGGREVEGAPAKAAASAACKNCEKGPHARAR
ncbi:hypothetical protein FGB62_117g021 [Gracilaria domingensis]|nr:hypothetical protein FGB62_117g021 [Gracilaria domingensis]